MKNFKKPFALVLAAAMTLGLTACSEGDGGSGGGGNSTTTAATTTKAPEQSFAEVTAAPIDETAATGTITWLMYEDLLPNNADRGSGDEYFETLGTLIATGDSPDIVRYEWRSFPHAMSYNMYTPLDDYIDLDSDLWKGVKEIAEQFVYNGKHYYVPYQYKTNFALNYNNRVLEENGMQDPMKLVKENNWTWKTFEEMLKKWVDMDPNHIGYNGVGGMSFILTTGTKVIDVKGDQIINNLRTENVTRCMNWLENMRKNGLLGANETQIANGASSGYVAPDQAFVDGNLLFLGMDPSWTYPTAKEALDKAGLENEIKFVPFPRDDLSDTYYHGVDTYGYLIPSGAPNVKGALDWIELNRVEETDEENIAKAKADALDDSISYYPKCANSECNDTSDSHDDKGRHIFTAEENEDGAQRR